MWVCSNFNHFLLEKNEPSIIVAGGSNSSVQRMASVEIYNQGKKVWELGPPLPEPVSRGSGIEYKGDFLVVGGLSTGGETGNIYRFNVKSGWSKMNSKPLPPNTFGAVAVLVTRDFCLATR